MARPRKISEATEEHILELVQLGHCLKDVAAEVGVSDITIKRYRDCNPEFNKRFLECTQIGWENLPNYYEKPHTEPPVASQGQIRTIDRPETWMGLPIRPRPTDYSVDTPYYLNPTTAEVEIIKNGILRVCPMDLWERNHIPQLSEPFIIEVF